MDIVSFKLFLVVVSLFLFSIVWWKIWQKEIISRNNEEKEFLPLAHDYGTWCYEHPLIVGSIISFGLVFFISILPCF